MNVHYTVILNLNYQLVLELALLVLDEHLLKDLNKVLRVTCVIESGQYLDDLVVINVDFLRKVVLKV